MTGSTVRPQSGEPAKARFRKPPAHSADDVFLCRFPSAPLRFSDFRLLHSGKRSGPEQGQIPTLPGSLSLLRKLEFAGPVQPRWRNREELNAYSGFHMNV